MDEDLTVGEIVNTMTTAQKNTLYFYLGVILKGRVVTEPPYASIESFNKNQRKVLDYLVAVALEESREDDVLEIVKE